MTKRKAKTTNKKRQLPTLSVELAERIRAGELDRLGRPKLLAIHQQQFQDVAERMSIIDADLLSRYATSAERRKMKQYSARLGVRGGKGLVEALEEIGILYRTFELRSEMERLHAEGRQRDAEKLEDRHYLWLTRLRLSRAALLRRGWRDATIHVEETIITITFSVPDFEPLRAKWALFLRDMKRRFHGEVPVIRHSTWYPMIDPTASDETLRYRTFQLTI
jgi:hypothetical protein